MDKIKILYGVIKRTGVHCTPALRSLSFVDLFINAWCCLKQDLQMIQFYQYQLEEYESAV